MSHTTNAVFPSYNFNGKVALITGGTRGLGRAFAEALVQCGCRVAVSGVHDFNKNEACQKSCDSLPFEFFQADLSIRNDQLDLIPKVLDWGGRLDILVNAAGIQYREPSLDFDLALWDKILSLMLTAPFILCQQAGRVMVKQGGGKIVNIASLSSFQGGWTVPAYTAAKHGIAGITKALANEWASKNINVNAIAPGYFATDMTRAILDDPVREPATRSRIPVGRWGVPDDLTGALLFLVSDAANYIHGHTLVVDGGWLAR